MSSRRVQRMQELILEVLSELIVLKVKDPRLQSLSLTGVRITPDLKKAMVTYSLYDDTADKAAAQKSLEGAAGFFRREIGSKLEIKHTPEIRFEFDRNMEYAQHMAKVLKDLKPESEGPPLEEDHNDK